MHSKATQSLAGGTLIPPRTFVMGIQLGPQDGSQQTDDPCAVEVSSFQTMPYSGLLLPFSSQFSHGPLAAGE